MAQLHFHGGAGQVTGSMHLVEARDKLVALDCGLFQGRREESNRLNRQFPRRPKDIHAVILSHAHIDHSGRLPLLVREGFKGAIYSTAATRDLCSLMLTDSAHIQEEDARYFNKRRDRNERAIEPLYNIHDVRRTIRLFRTIEYGGWFKVASGIHARFHDAGHILGSAAIELEVKDEKEARTRIVFTGDVGRPNSPLLRNPDPLPPCDYLISESTYGNRTTESFDSATELLRETIVRTAERKGKVVIPAFAVGRTQNIIFCLRRMFLANEIPKQPVFIDSPMAVHATDIYRMHPVCYNDAAQVMLEDHGRILDGPNCRFVKSAEESKQIDRYPGPCIIISASGMCESGRVLHHLRHTISEKANTILMVGFQAAHTLGRRIRERQPEVRIFGVMRNLEAEVVTIDGFSAHADRDELLAHVLPVASGCKQVFLVHGEEEQSSAFAALLKEHDVEALVPVMDESFPIVEGLHPETD